MSGTLRTVLIFAHECAPYHRVESTIGAQRPAQFAKYLPEFGWRAIVLCCDSAERGTSWPADVAERALARLRGADPAESIIVPTPALPWDGTTDRLWRRTLPGPSGPNRARDLLRKPLTVAKLFTGDYSQAWQPCARQAADAIAREVRVDVCIGEHSPDAGLFLARGFARRYGVPWVADFRDAILQPLRLALRPPYAAFLKWLLSSAAQTVNVTPYWAELDARLFRRPSVAIPNGFDPEEFSAPLPGGPNERFTVAYAGNIWPQMRLAIFLEGLALLRELLGGDEYRRVRFQYRGGHSAEVSRQARESGVADVVDSGGHIPRAESLAMLRRADLLLLLSIAEPGRQDRYLSRGIYPGKTFEYFGARRPIICVPGDRGLTSELLERTRTGVSLATPRQVAEYLALAVREWRLGRQLGYRPREDEVAQYTRRALTGRLAGVLDAVSGSAPAGAPGGGGAMAAALGEA